MGYNFTLFTYRDSIKIIPIVNVLLICDPDNLDLSIWHLSKNIFAAVDNNMQQTVACVLYYLLSVSEPLHHIIF